MILGKNSLNLNFKHCVNLKFLNREFKEILSTETKS